MSIKFPNLKQFFSLFLAAVMMVSLLAVNAHAAHGGNSVRRPRAYLVPVREPGQNGITGRGQADRPGQHHHGLFAGDILIRPHAAAGIPGKGILANGLGEKTLDLNNVTIKGRLVVWGGSAVNFTGKSAVAGGVPAPWPQRQRPPAPGRHSGA